MELEAADENVICQLRPFAAASPMAYNSCRSGAGAELRGQEDIDTTALTNDATKSSSEQPSASPVCHWCCHAFGTPEILVPCRMVEDTYVGEGSYCSFPCAAAALFDKHLDSNTAWTRYQMLNDMSFRAGGGLGTVVRAPPRTALQMFGGTMTIDKFRGKPLADAILTRAPPMICDQPRLEVVSSSHVYRDVFVPIDDDRIKQYKARLQRVKPRKNFMSTLDYVLENGISTQQ